MNRLPLLFAEAFGCISAGIVVAAVICGVVIARVAWKRASEKGQPSVRRATERKASGAATTTEKAFAAQSDFDMINQLPVELRSYFCNSLERDFLLKPGWLFDNVLASQLDGDESKFDLLLEKMITVSNGAYRAVAKVGDVFNCDSMTTANDMPADLIITTVYHRGLIRVSTGEVLERADVA